MSAFMQIPLVPIGNSKGVRLPKALLTELAVSDTLDLTVEEGRIILTPLPSAPRSGWQKAFLKEKQEPTPLLPNLPTSFDQEEWQW
jgi:antitoxin MazE